MNCPACKEPLIALECEEVEVDYCVVCKGVWLDAGELELLFGDRQLAEGFMTAGNREATKDAKKRRCPECDKRMELWVTGGDHPVTYDKCPRGDGLWFDNGELVTVLKYGSEQPGAAPVAAWLTETFGGTPGSDT